MRWLEKLSDALSQFFQRFVPTPEEGETLNRRKAISAGQDLCDAWDELKEVIIDMHPTNGVPYVKFFQEIIMRGDRAQERFKKYDH